MTNSERENLGRPLNPADLQPGKFYLAYLFSPFSGSVHRVLVIQPTGMKDASGNDIYSYASATEVGMGTYDQIVDRYECTLSIHKAPPDCDSLGYLADAGDVVMICMQRRGGSPVRVLSELDSFVKQAWRQIETWYPDKDQQVCVFSGKYLQLVLGKIPLEFETCAEAERKLGMTLDWDTTPPSSYLGIINGTLAVRVPKKNDQQEL